MMRSEKDESLGTQRNPGKDGHVGCGERTLEGLKVQLFMKCYGNISIF